MTLEDCKGGGAALRNRYVVALLFQFRGLRKSRTWCSSTRRCPSGRRPRPRGHRQRGTMLHQFSKTLLFRGNYRYLPTVLFFWYLVIFIPAAAIEEVFFILPSSSWEEVDDGIYKSPRLSPGLRAVGKVTYPIRESGEVLEIVIDVLLPQSIYNWFLGLGFTESRAGFLTQVKSLSPAGESLLFLVTFPLLWFANFLVVRLTSKPGTH